MSLARLVSLPRGSAPPTYYVGQGYVFEVTPNALTAEQRNVLQATRARILPRRARRRLLGVDAWRKGHRSPSAVRPDELAAALGRQRGMTIPRRDP